MVMFCIREGGDVKVYNDGKYAGLKIITDHVHVPIISANQNQKKFFRLDICLHKNKTDLFTLVAIIDIFC